MEYFIVCQNESYQNTVYFKIKSANPIQRRIEVTKEDVKDVKGTLRFYVRSQEDVFYPDILDIPIFLVSDKLAKVFKYFFQTEDFRSVLLSDAKNKQNHLYWLPILEKIECLHESSEFSPKGLERNLVLDREKIGGRKIFRIDRTFGKTVVVNLEIAESILRRNSVGVSLKQIDIA